MGLVKEFVCLVGMVFLDVVNGGEFQVGDGDDDDGGCGGVCDDDSVDDEINFWFYQFF